MKDDLGLRESPAQFDRGASNSSPDIDDRRSLTVFLPIVVVDQCSVQEAFGSNHGLVGAVAGKSRFGSFESFPDRHSVFDFERTFIFARESDAVYDVDPSFVCVIGPDEVRFQHTIVSSIACGYSDAPMAYPLEFFSCAERKTDDRRLLAKSSDP